VKRFPWISLALLLTCYAGFGWYLSGFEIPHPRWMVSGCFQIMGTPMPQAESLDIQQKSPQAEWLERLIASNGGSSKPQRSEKPSMPIAPEIGELRPPAAVAEERKTLPNPTLPPTARTVEHPPLAPSPTRATPDPAIERNATFYAETNVETRSPQPPQTQQQKICNLAFKHNFPISLLAVSWIFISSIAFISPLTSFDSFLSRWFHSDTTAFMVLFAFAGLAAVILFWLHVFLQILTVLAAEALARIDMQAARMSGIQAYWILTFVSLTGLTVGWFANGVL
jgi:hypothetical protein